jgi:hypothetical protein
MNRNHGAGLSAWLLCLVAFTSCGQESHDIAANDDTQRSGNQAGSPSAAGEGRATGNSKSGDGIVRGDTPTDAAVLGTATGPYAVMMYSDGYRRGTKYADSTIFYPLDAKPPFAATAIVPGFVSPQSSIITWGPFLASFGIVTMTIGTNSLSDPPEARKDALLDALETLKSEHMRAGSPLHDALALDRLSTMGWSMGGGGTLLAADEHPELKATISMCAWNPGYQYTQIASPTLMFASQGDPLAGGQSQGFYMSVPDATPKMLIETPGGDHFVATNPANQNGMIGRYGLAWLKVFLEGDQRYRKFLLEMPAVATTDFRTNLE